MLVSRRSILKGLIAAPIICTPGLLMPVKSMAPEWAWHRIDGTVISYNSVTGTYQIWSGYDSVAGLNAIREHLALNGLIRVDLSPAEQWVKT